MTERTAGAMARADSTCAPRRVRLRRAVPGVLAVAALAAAAPAQASDWVKLRPLKGARTGIAATTAPNGKVYAIGGAHAQAVLPTVSIYDAATNAWSPGPRLPQGDCPRRPEECGVIGAIAATGSDGRIYVFDGNPTRPTALALDPAGGGWQAVPAMPTPRPGVVGAAGRDGRIYTLGGIGNEAGAVPSRWNEIFDPATQSWSLGAPMLSARVRHMVVGGADGRIYVLGGLVGDQVLDTVEVYDPVTDTWAARARMPVGRYDGAAALGRDGRIYVFGGAVQAPGPLPTMTDVYDPETNTWSSGPALHVPRLELAAAVAPRGRILAIGGRQNEPVRAVEGLRLGR